MAQTRQFTGFRNCRKCRPRFRYIQNDNLRGTYNTDSQIKFKTFMLSSSLCDFSDTCILVKGTVIVTYAGATAASNNREKKCNI